MRKTKGIMPVVAAAALLISAGSLFGLAATQTDYGPFSVIDANPDQNQNQNQQNQGPEKLQWTDHELPLDVVAPVASDFKVTAFKASPDSEGDYGNYKTFNTSQATSGLTAGVDYFQETATGSKTVTFPANLKMPSGASLQFAIVDTAATQEFHPAFVDASVPSEVSKIDYENGNSQTIISGDAFKRKPSVSSDSSSIEQINGDAAEYSDYDGSSTNLAGSAYKSETGETATLERTIELNHGSMALGTVDVTNVSDDLSSGDVEIYYRNSDGQKVTVFDKTVAEGGSENTDMNMEIPDLGDDEKLGANPEWVNKDLHIKYELEFDGSAVSADEELLEVGVKNIYGNYVGSTNTVAALA